MKKRKVVVVTGTRADYGIYYSVLKAIEKHPDLELSLVVTGMHLSPEFGNTVREIEKDGFKIDATVDMLLSADTGSAIAKSVGIGLMGMAQAFEALNPDIMVVLGDRGEMLAAAIAAEYMNIPIAHIHGGDLTGTVDEIVRHAITKLSHIHFTATPKSAERVLKLGEEKIRVYVVGSPSIDYIKNLKLIKRSVMEQMFNLDTSKPILLMTQHPVSTEIEHTEKQIRETMEALVELKEQTIVTYPNSDWGGRIIIRVIQQYQDQPFLKIYKNLSQDDYLNLLKLVDVMVGNSSSGIIEAPSFGLPVVNIGTRQDGRERAENVIDVGYNKDEIVSAVRKALFDEDFKKRAKQCINPYGDGNTGPRIADILSKIRLSPELLRKKITF